MPLDGVLRVHLLSKENSMEKPGKRTKTNAICIFYFFPLCCFVVRLFVLSLSLSSLFCFHILPDHFICKMLVSLLLLFKFVFCFVFFTTFCFSSGGLEKSKLGLKKCLLNLMTARLLTKSVSTFFQLFWTSTCVYFIFFLFVWFLISFCWVYCGARRIGSKGHNGADFTFNYVARPFVIRGGKGRSKWAHNTPLLLHTRNWNRNRN